MTKHPWTANASSGLPRSTYERAFELGVPGRGGLDPDPRVPRRTHHTHRAARARDRRIRERRRELRAPRSRPLMGAMGARRRHHGRPALRRRSCPRPQRGWRPIVELRTYAVGLVAVGVGLAAIHGASDPFAGTLAAGAIVGEVARISGDGGRLLEVRPWRVGLVSPRSRSAVSRSSWAGRVHRSAGRTACSNGMPSGTCWSPSRSSRTPTRSRSE